MEPNIVDIMVSFLWVCFFLEMDLEFYFPQKTYLTFESCQQQQQMHLHHQHVQKSGSFPTNNDNDYKGIFANNPNMPVEDDKNTLQMELQNYISFWQKNSKLLQVSFFDSMIFIIRVWFLEPSQLF